MGVLNLKFVLISLYKFMYIKGSIIAYVQPRFITRTSPKSADQSTESVFISYNS